MSDLFAKTTPQQAPAGEPEQEDPIKPRGIGLRASEWKRIEEIGRELGMKTHALAMYALRDFVRRYEAGEIKTETKKSLPGI